MKIADAYGEELEINTIEFYRNIDLFKIERIRGCYFIKSFLFFLNLIKYINILLSKF
jgi:hypothetical protein